MPIGSGNFYQTVYYASRFFENPTIVLRSVGQNLESEVIGMLKNQHHEDIDGIHIHLISFEDYLNHNIPSECDGIIIYEIDKLLEYINDKPTTIVYNT